MYWETPKQSYLFDVFARLNFVKRVISIFLSDQMSSNTATINAWVPAFVVFVWGCIWKYRCRIWTFCGRFCPCILGEVALDQDINLLNNIVSNLSNRNDVEQGDLEVNQELGGCTSLTTLPEGLGNLSSLTTLNLSLCSRLTMLPEGLRKLSSLISLDLVNCSSLTTLPEELGNLTSLTTLPEGLGNLSSLRSLDLAECSSLTTLPEEFGELGGLGNLSSLTMLPRDWRSISFDNLWIWRGVQAWEWYQRKLANVNLTSMSTCPTLSRFLHYKRFPCENW